MIKNQLKALCDISDAKQERKCGNMRTENLSGCCYRRLMRISVQRLLHSTKALSDTVEAGLLACNIFTVLPMLRIQYSGQQG